MTYFSLLVSVFTLQFFTFSMFMVEGTSMEPTLMDDDLLIIEKVWDEGLNYDRGDIIVFSLDDDPDYFYVKRIIGLPGESLSIQEDGIYIREDDILEKLPELYLFAGTSSVPKTGAYKEDFKQVYNVPTDSFFVLGDNRTHSMDSRYFEQAFINRSNVEGRLVFNLTSTEDELVHLVTFNTDKGITLIEIEIVGDSASRSKGLMHRTELDDGKGMFFIFDNEDMRNFWMKNTLIPLDMLFIDENLQVVHIEKQALPCKEDPCAKYNSKLPAQYVLEIGGGQSDVLGIEVGDKALLNFNL